MCGKKCTAKNCYVHFSVYFTVRTYSLTWSLYTLFKNYCIYLSAFSASITADDLASKNNSPISFMSSLTIFVLPQILAVTAAGANSWTAYRRVVFAPTSPKIDKASSST